MTAAWEWLKKWGGTLFGAIAALLLILTGAGWLWRRQEAAKAAALDEASIADAKAEMMRLEAIRGEVTKRVGEQDEAIVVLDEQIREQKVSVARAAGAGEGLTDDELEDAYRTALGG